jgi:hypothetical protein
MIPSTQPGQSQYGRAPAAMDHPFMGIIRLCIEQYQRQSVSHAERVIEAVQYKYKTHNSNVYNVQSSFRIEVTFKSSGSEADSICTTCRAEFVGAVPTGRVLAKKGNNYISLYKFLSASFPMDEAPNDFGTVWDWSIKDGFIFNWAGLPVELKERVVELCMHQPRDQGCYSTALSLFRKRPTLNTDIGPYEVIDQLGYWYGLLSASRQIRVTTLMLCLQGSSSLTFRNGLCLSTTSVCKLEEYLNRLGRYYQMVEEQSVPLDSKELACSRNYNRFPTIYPHLRQYATLRHGIRKIHLSMGFAEYMNFFGATAGELKKYLNPRHLTYEVFERLSCLDEVVIKLPLRPKGGWENNFRQGGARLFHPDSPCPRMIHRNIYERIAEVLAS